MPNAFITGVSGLRFSASEKAFLRAAEPAGVILFSRNCETVEQIRRLVGDAGDAIGSSDVLFLIDQEGGRVQRLMPPNWRAYPSGQDFATAFDRRGEEALHDIAVVTRLLAGDLVELGVNVNCAPVLDLRIEAAHAVIGERAYGTAPEDIRVIATAVVAGLQASGIGAVGKHVPGHGRATTDTHEELAIVQEDRTFLSTSDFEPFREFAARVPAMMTAHVVYADIDDGEPASTSRRVHSEIIRGEIGFDGLLMSDDLSMQALDGPIGRRAERVLSAGSDLALHCNGDLAEMEAVASAVPRLSAKSVERIEALHAWRSQVEPFEVSDGEAALARIRQDNDVA